jgi:hypothetical protein
MNLRTMFPTTALRLAVHAAAFPWYLQNYRLQALRLVSPSSRLTTAGPALGVQTWNLEILYQIQGLSGRAGTHLLVQINVMHLQTVSV